jgi:hypothetical protein
MKNRMLSTGFLVCFVFSMLVAGGVFAAKDEIEFSPAYGKVKFTHTKHSETLKVACVQCHHTW